jgi:Tfp pilus assembly protein PilN
MINLLPPDVKQGSFYARQNTKLLKWCLALVVAILGMGLVVAFGLFYMNQSVHNYTSQIQKTQQQLKAQNLEKTQARIDDISGSLKLVVQVLSREVLFSKLLKQIGSAIPAQASLTDLRIGKVEGAIDLTAITSDYNTGTQVQVNLQDPNNKIFDKADLVSITCSSASTADLRYPCTVTIRAQFAKNNPYLFIQKAKP